MFRLFISGQIWPENYWILQPEHMPCFAFPSPLFFHGWILYSEGVNRLGGRTMAGAKMVAGSPSSPQKSQVLFFSGRETEGVTLCNITSYMLHFCVWLARIGVGLGLNSSSTLVAICQSSRCCYTYIMFSNETGPKS